MLKIISKLANSLAESFSKPQSYGSQLEYYIVSNNPQNEGDVDRLTREFHARTTETHVWARGF
jgi:hypothetical protein